MENISSRYANALLSIAIEEKKIVEYKFAFNEFYSFLLHNEEIFKYLNSYFVDEEQRFTVIDEITSFYKLVNFSSFIKLLIKKHRFNDLKHIKKEFVKLCNEKLGIYDGYVYSTYLLNQDEINKVENSISNLLNHKVELTNKIDESLIGGIKVAISDHVFDGSIKNKIEVMKNKLNERSK